MLKLNVVIYIAPYLTLTIRASSERGVSYLGKTHRRATPKAHTYCFLSWLDPSPSPAPSQNDRVLLHGGEWNTVKTDSELTQVDSATRGVEPVSVVAALHSRSIVALTSQRH